MRLADHIESIEGVCGGEPVIQCTRITVDHLWQCFFRLKWSVDMILEQYPHLTRPQIAAAIRYAKEHPEIISASIDD